MKTIFIITTFLCTVVISAQTIENFSIDSGGASSVSGSINILYTVGEVNIQEHNIGNINLSEGFVNSTIVSSTLGLEDEDLLNDSIIIYPNPASEIINISSTLTIEKVQLFDSVGKEVITVIESTQLKIHNLSSGLYMLKVFTQFGQLTKKIIVN